MSTQTNALLEIEAAIRTLERRADKLEYEGRFLNRSSHMQDERRAGLDEARAIRAVVAEVRRTMDDGR